MRSDIREGETFPDCELADESSREQSLSELQGGNSMVLHLSRGGFDRTAGFALAALQRGTSLLEDPDDL